MELRHLRYFVAVAETLHFGKAADRLHIAQPSLSQQIRQLEAEIGAPLFLRTKRQVELTDAGKSFLKHTYQMLARLEEACEEARKINRGETGTLVFGYAGTMHDTLLQLLLSYRSKFPNVRLVLEHLSIADQVKALHEGRIDIGVVSPPIDSTLSLHTILEVPFVVALPASHPLVSEPSPLDIMKLAEEPFIMYPRTSGEGFYDAIISMCHQAGFSPRVIQEAQGLPTIFALVAAEMGITITTKLSMQHPSRGVVFKELNTNTLVETSLAWRKDENSPLVNTFLTSAEEFLSQQNN